MNRNSGDSSGLPADGSAPSEAWLFAQAILGNPIPNLSQHLPVSAAASRRQLKLLAESSAEVAEELRQLDAAELKARRDRELLEWAAAISPEAEQKLRALERQQAEERESWRRAQEYAETLLEGTWDASKHPRGGYPQNRGWWSPSSGAGGSAANSTASEISLPLPLPTDSGARSSSSHYAAGGRASRPGAAFTAAAGPEVNQNQSKVHAQFASNSNQKNAPVEFVAARPAGHHWVPWAVFLGLESKMDEDAIKVFKEGTKSPVVYNHAFDTWNGVKHGEYSDAMHALLEDWIKVNGGHLDKSGAQKFLSWIARGECNKAEFAAKHKELFAKVFKWRKGFLQSIVIAHAAAELNPKLTAAELKAIARHIVDGTPLEPLSRAAAKTARAVVAGGKPLLKAVAKRVLPALSFFSAVIAAQRGWAGQGHTGDGAWGALDETMRDLMIADVIEPIVFPGVLNTVDGVTNLVVPGLNDPTRNRYIWRSGRLYDLKTGQIIDRPAQPKRRK